MKKSLFSLATAAMLAAFASCTQDETMDMTYVNGPVNSTLTVELPTEGLKTRALPTMPADHQLRCILEVRQGGSSIDRKTATVTADAGAENLTFSLSLEEGDYDFVLWADYVDPGSTTDKYYNTTDLNAVSVIDPSSLFNTDVCDAFFGTATFTKSGTDLQTTSVKLTRALAKVIVSNSDASALYKASTVDVSLQLPNTFNVTDKSATGSVEATLTDADLLGDSRTDARLFSFYTFVNGDAQGTLGQIMVTFDNNPAVAIPAGVPVQRNYRTNATGTFLEPDASVTGEVTVTVDVDGAWGGSNIDQGVTPEEPVVAPKVGDFYYNDGTWSSALNPDKTCIGIVFSTDAAKFEDNIENYAGSGLTSEIKGYVVALDNVMSGGAKSGAFAEGTSIADLNFKAKSGYVNTVGLMAADVYETAKLALFTNFETYRTTTVPAPPQSSGWYIPSQAQLIEYVCLYDGNEEQEIAKSDAFYNAVEQFKDVKGNDGFGGAYISSGTLNMFSSTITAGNVQAVQAKSSTSDPGWGFNLLKGFVLCKENAEDTKTQFNGNLRPILTF